MNIILLQAAEGQGSAQLLFFGLIFVVMYFFMIRPQVKKQKKENKFRSELSKGDQIITIGGIHGKISDVKEDTFIVEIMGGNTLKIEKSAVSMSGDAGIDQK